MKERLIISMFATPGGRATSWGLANLKRWGNSMPPSRLSSTSRRAIEKREWKEYEEAVTQKDLERALRFLVSVHNEQQELTLQKQQDLPLQPFPEDYDPEPAGAELGYWQLLDACFNATDMKLVSAAYAYLQNRNLLPSFSKFRNIAMEGKREVTPSVLLSETGLEATKLSPKKWGVSGPSSVLVIGLLAGSSILLSQGVDIRINLSIILGLSLVDSLALGGSGVAVISSYWPPYKRRILVHEAGHLLVAYILGCPIRGVVLDPFAALQMGTQGQAGTQFWDESLSKELADGKISGASFDRYCIVLFAGIAAEALVYGEAEGGENDENLFKSICVLLKPPMSVREMSNHARWSVMQAYNLLKWHREAHKAAVQALESGVSLSVVIRRIEEAMAASS